MSLERKEKRELNIFTGEVSSAFALQSSSPQVQTLSMSLSGWSSRSYINAWLLPPVTHHHHNNFVCCVVFPFYVAGKLVEPFGSYSGSTN